MFRATKNVDEIRKCRAEFRRIGAENGITLPAMEGDPMTFRKELRLLKDEIGVIVRELKRRETEFPEQKVEIALVAQQVLQQYEAVMKR